MTYYSETLKCHWDSWSQVGPFILRLDMPVGNCCDMGGCVRMAAAILPEVQKIYTFSGGEQDTTYIREDWWKAEPLNGGER